VSYGTVPDQRGSWTLANFQICEDQPDTEHDDMLVQYTHLTVRGTYQTVDRQTYYTSIVCLASSRLWCHILFHTQRSFTIVGNLITISLTAITNNYGLSSTLFLVKTLHQIWYHRSYLRIVHWHAEAHPPQQKHRATMNSQARWKLACWSIAAMQLGPACGLCCDIGKDK
jgi:hypothetical protein